MNIEQILAKVKNHPLYGIAEKEVEEILPHDIEERRISADALRTLMIACYLLGCTEKRAMQ